ncbi:MAG TPA: hypothetical protein VFO45_02620 [Sphingomicrobium sp.]|nr:hypothetical protein [Sphingomicrobium sp.]
MRSNERLQRILAIRKLGGVNGASYAVAKPDSGVLDDARLFALTFTCGFLFTTIFLA